MPGLRFALRTKLVLGAKRRRGKTLGYEGAQKGLVPGIYQIASCFGRSIGGPSQVLFVVSYPADRHPAPIQFETQRAVRWSPLAYTKTRLNVLKGGY